MDTKEVNSANTPLIVSDGCCVHFGNAPALEGVTFSISRGKKVCNAIISVFFISSHLGI